MYFLIHLPGYQPLNNYPEISDNVYEIPIDPFTDIDENNKPKWEKVRFAPISVSNSIDKDAIVGDDGYFINNHYMNREIVLQVLFESFYDDIKKMTVALNDANRLYDDAIVRIIYNNIIYILIKL